MATQAFKVGDKVLYYPEESRMMRHANRIGKVVKVVGSGFFKNKPPFLYDVDLGNALVLYAVREHELSIPENS